MDVQYATINIKQCIIIKICVCTNAIIIEFNNVNIIENKYPLLLLSVFKLLSLIHI